MMRKLTGKTTSDARIPTMKSCQSMDTEPRTWLVSVDGVIRPYLYGLSTVQGDVMI